MTNHSGQEINDTRKKRDIKMKTLKNKNTRKPKRSNIANA